jgi:hypothetical protein
MRANLLKSQCTTSKRIGMKQWRKHVVDALDQMICNGELDFLDEKI